MQQIIHLIITKNRFILINLNSHYLTFVVIGKIRFATVVG